MTTEHATTGTGLKTALNMTVPKDAVPMLKSRLAAALRKQYEPAGFVADVDDEPGAGWFFTAHRGLSGGFTVGMLPDGKEPTATLAASRASRLSELSGWVAGGVALAVFVVVLVPLLVLPVPVPAVWGVIAAAAVAVLVLAGLFSWMTAFVNLMERLGGGRLDDAQLADLTALVRKTADAARAAADPAARYAAR